MSKYRIIGRQRFGTNVLKYILNEIGTSNIISIEKEKVYALAFNKQIADVIIQNYNGKINMKGVGYKISDLPCYDEEGNKIRHDNDKNTKPLVKITGKCADGKSIKAYRISVIDCGRVINERIIPREKVMDLAKNGMISNVRYQRSNGTDILRGVDCKLSELPSLSYQQVM